jgi:hypothetical protein
MDTNQLDSVVQLIKALSEAEQATVLRLLMQDRSAQTELVGDVEQHLKAYEGQYQMSSEEFHRRFQAGELGDSADFFEWNTYYEMVRDSQLLHQGAA